VEVGDEKLEPQRSEVGINQTTEDSKSRRTIQIVKTLKKKRAGSTPPIQLNCKKQPEVQKRLLMAGSSMTCCGAVVTTTCC
jgi:hypothetical protein